MEHQRNPAQMDGRGLRRDLRHPILEQGYFSINDLGHVVCHPQGPDAGAIDLKELVDEVVRRGIGLPLLIRFSDILKSRVVELHEAFKRAITEYGYKGEYRGVYPIKVNQHRYVVEEIVQFGPALPLRPGGWFQARAAGGDGHPPTTRKRSSCCNGYKDEEYIETALMCSKPRAQGAHRGREILPNST